MEKFTSSNGGTVEMLGNRRMIVTDTNGHKLNEDASVKSHSSWLDPNQVDTLREYFLHEQGIWRDPETGALVIPDKPHSEQGGRRYVSVFLDQQMHGCNEVNALGTAEHHPIARRYFAAHPESKPLPSEPHTAWVDKYGTDIWWVDGLGRLRCCASPSSDPAKYAPFTRLVPEVSDVA